MQCSVAAASHTPEETAAAEEEVGEAEAARGAVDGAALAACSKATSGGGSGSSWALAAPAKEQHGGCGGPGNTLSTIGSSTRVPCSMIRTWL